VYFARSLTLRTRRDQHHCWLLSEVDAACK
jgi:hypothetical protein